MKRWPHSAWRWGRPLEEVLTDRSDAPASPRRTEKAGLYQRHRNKNDLKRIHLLLDR